MAELILLRHSTTRGNLEGRYIGCRTDEPLSSEGIRLLKGRTYPAVDQIYTSPMKRCVETAQVIWGDGGQIPITKVFGLQECDFGDFENKNYEELNGDPAYQAWIDSGGTLPFPKGESTEAFKKRCQEGFERLIIQIQAKEQQRKKESKDQVCTPFRAALVVHGGTIMAILEHFGDPKKHYFDYQVKNGCGYVLTPVEGTKLWNYQRLPWGWDF